ncbi:autotransporter outer membrane beta-barrel domain-containing protein [Bartonella sp. cb54]|uniref:autotransporter outer membrane beta-barrel domain-containing protein n=1 Tax=Bartonella sp. cb54 TaxID=3385560 RepID=UPI0039A5B902
MINVLKNHTRLCAITTSVFFFLQGVNAGIGKPSGGEGYPQVCYPFSANIKPRSCQQHVVRDGKNGVEYTLEESQFQIDGSNAATNAGTSAAISVGVSFSDQPSTTRLNLQSQTQKYSHMYYVRPVKDSDEAYFIAKGVSITGENFTVNAEDVKQGNLSSFKGVAVQAGARSYITLEKSGETPSKIDGFLVGLKAIEGGKITIKDGAIGALAVGASTTGASSSIELQDTVINMKNTDAVIGLLGESGAITMSGGSISAGAATGVGAQSNAGATITLTGTEIQMRGKTSDVALMSAGGAINMTNGSIAAKNRAVLASNAGSIITLSGTKVQEGGDAGDVGLESKAAGQISMTNGSIAAKEKGAKVSGAGATITLTGTQIQMGGNTSSADAIGLEGEQGNITMTNGSIVAKKVGAKTLTGATITLTGTKVQEGTDAGDVGLESAGGTITMTNGSIAAKKVGVKTSDDANVTLNNVQIQMGGSTSDSGAIGLENESGRITVTDGSVVAKGVGAKTSSGNATIILTGTKVQEGDDAGNVGLESAGGQINMTNGSIAAKEVGAKTSVAEATITLTGTQIQMGGNTSSADAIGLESARGKINMTNGSIAAKKVGVKTSVVGATISLTGTKVQEGANAGDVGLESVGGQIAMTNGSITAKKTGAKVSGEDAVITLTGTQIEMSKHAGSVGLLGEEGGVINVQGGTISADNIGVNTSDDGTKIILNNVRIQKGDGAGKYGLMNAGGQINMINGSIAVKNVGVFSSGVSDKNAEITLNGTQIEMGQYANSVALASANRGNISVTGGKISAGKVGAKTSAAGAIITLSDTQIEMDQQHANSIGLESVGGTITVTGGGVSAGKIGAKTSAAEATITLSDTQIQMVEHADSIGLKSDGGQINMTKGAITAKKVGAQSSAAGATITLSGTQIQMGQYEDSTGLISEGGGAITMTGGEISAKKIGAQSSGQGSEVTLSDMQIAMGDSADAIGLISESGGKIEITGGSISAGKIGVKAKDQGSTVILKATTPAVQVNVSAVGLESEGGGAITMTNGVVSAVEVGAQSLGQGSEVTLSSTQIQMGQHKDSIGLKSKGGKIIMADGEVSAGKVGAQSSGQESTITLSGAQITMGDSADAIGLISDGGGAITMTGGEVSAKKIGAQSSGQESKIILSGAQITMGGSANAIGLSSDSGGAIDAEYGSISANKVGAQSSGQGSRISLRGITVGERANAVAIGLKSSDGGAIEMTNGSSISASEVGAQSSGADAFITLSGTQIQMDQHADSIGLKSSDGGAITMTGGTISAQKLGAQLSGQGSEITLNGTQIQMERHENSIGLKSEGGKLTMTNGSVSAGKVGAESSNAAEIILTGTTVSAGKVGETTGLKSAGGKITMTGGSISATDRGVDAQGSGSEVTLTKTKIGTLAKTEIDALKKTVKKAVERTELVTVTKITIADEPTKKIDVEKNFPLIGIYSTSGTITVTDGWIFAKGTGVQSTLQSNVTLSNTVVDMGDNVGATGIISDSSTLAMTGGLIVANDTGISADDSIVTLNGTMIEMGDNAAAIGIVGTNSTITIKDGLVLANNLGVAAKQGSKVTLIRTDVDMGDGVDGIGILVETSKVEEVYGKPSALTMEGGSVFANKVGIKALNKDATVTLKGTVIEGGNSADTVGLIGEEGSIIKVDRGEISANGVGIKTQDSTVTLSGTRIKMKDNVSAKGLVSENSTITMEDGAILAKGVGIESSKKSTVTLNGTEIIMESNKDSIGLISDDSTIDMDRASIFADKVGIESRQKSIVSLNDVKIDMRKNGDSIGLVGDNSTIKMDDGSVSAGKVGIQLSKISTLTLSGTEIQMGKDKDSTGIESDNSVVTMDGGFISARGVGIKADQVSTVTLNNADIRMIDNEDAIGLVSEGRSTVTMTKGKISTQGVGVQSGQDSTVTLNGTDIRMGKNNKGAIALLSKSGTIQMTGGSVTVDGVGVQSEGSEGRVTLDRVKIANASYFSYEQNDTRSAFLLKDGGSVTFINGNVNVTDFTGLRVTGGNGDVYNSLDPIDAEGPKQANIEKSDITVNGQGSYGMYFGEFQADHLRVRRAAQVQAPAKNLGSVLLKNATFRVPNGTAVYADNFAGHVFLKEGAMLSGEFLLKSKNGSDVFILSNGSSILGGADTDSTSLARIHLSNYSSWLLTQTGQNVSCLNNMSACVSSVDIENSNIQFSGETGQGYKYQTLYIGNGTGGVVYNARDRAVLYLKAQQDLSGVGDEQVIDRLFIDGDVSGTTTVNVQGVKGSKRSGAQNIRSASSVSVIQVSGAAQQNSFKLGSEYITLGDAPYLYVLRAYAPTDEIVPVDAGFVKVRFDGETDTNRKIWDFRLEKEVINNEIVIASSTKPVIPNPADVLSTPSADAPVASETAAAGGILPTDPYIIPSSSSSIISFDPVTGESITIVKLLDSDSTISGSEVEYSIVPSVDDVAYGLDTGESITITKLPDSTSSGSEIAYDIAPSVDGSEAAPALSDKVTEDVTRSDTTDAAAKKPVQEDATASSVETASGDPTVIKLVSEPKYLQNGDVFRYSDGSKFIMNLISDDVIINNPPPAPSKTVTHPVYFVSVLSDASARTGDADEKPSNSACGTDANETISKGNSVWCQDGKSYTITDKVIQMSDHNQHVVRVKRAQTSADAGNGEEVDNNKTTVTMEKVNIIGAGLVSERRDRIILKKLVSAVLAEQDGEAIIKESKIMSVPIGVEAQSGGSVKMTGGMIDALYVGALADSASSIRLEDGIEINVRGPLAVAGLSSSNGSTVSMNEGFIDFTNGVAVRSASGGHATLKGVSITGKREGVDPNSSSLADGAAILLSNGGSIDFDHGTVDTDSHGLWVVNSGTDRAQNIATIEGSVIEVSGDKSYGMYLDGALQENVEQSGLNKIPEGKEKETLVLNVENDSVQKDVSEPSTTPEKANQVVLVSEAQGDSATKSVRAKRGLVLPQENLAGEVTTISLKGTRFEAQDSTAVYGDNFKGRISLEEKTTLSGDLLLRSENNSDLSISANNSILIGGARVDSNSHAKIDLSNGSEWHLTKSKKASDTVSSISSISLKDSAIKFISSASEGGSPYQTLRIGNGSGTVYSAHENASIHLNARLNPEDLSSDQVTDRLLIHGGVSGQTIVHVHAVSDSVEQNKESAKTAHGVSIIQVYGTAEADSFKLNGDYVALGNSPYQYALRSYGPTARSQTVYFDEKLVEGGKDFWDFRLENQFVDVTDSAHALPTPSVDNTFESTLHPERDVRFKVVPQVPTYLLTPNSLFHVGLMDISNQNKQLEAMRTASSGISEAHENPALFLRGYSGSYRYASDLSKLEYGYGGDLSYNAVEAGILLQEIENVYSTVSFGVMGTYGKLSLQPLEVERSQESALDKWSVTAYGSMQHDAGFYVDGLLSYGLFKGDVLTLARGKTATLKGNPLSVSLTGGQAFVTGYEGFVLDPQVQVVYQNLQFNEARDVDNFDINMGKLDQWVVRVGGRLTKNPTGFEIGDASAVFFYGKLHLAHSFEKKQSVHFKDAFQLGAFGSSVEAGLGINARLSPNLALHGDLMYQHKLTKAGFSGTTFSGGMRYQF